MKITLLLSSVWLAARYLAVSDDRSIQHLMFVGLVWAAICLAIDIPLFIFVIGWPLQQYLADIPLGYLIVPIASGGMAKAFAMGASAQGDQTGNAAVP